MLLGGVVPCAITFALPFAIFVTVYFWTVLPRKNAPGVRLNWKR